MDKKKWMIRVFVVLSVVFVTSHITNNGFCIPPDYYNERVNYCKECNGTWDAWGFNHNHCVDDAEKIDCMDVPHGPEMSCTGNRYWGC
jgi:hypothetical protein